MWHAHWRIPHERMAHVVRVARWTGVHHVRRHSHRHSSARRCHWRWHGPHPVDGGSGHWELSGGILRSLPSLLRYFHGKLCSTLIFDLASLVNQLLGSSIIAAVYTFALATTHHTSLETLAILFEALRTLAAASHVVATGRRRPNNNDALWPLDGYSRLECVWVFGTGVLDGFIADGTL
jgi:hypothetical protein